MYVACECCAGECSMCLSVTCVFGLFLVLLLRPQCLFVFVFFFRQAMTCVFGDVGGRVKGREGKTL